MAEDDLTRSRWQEDRDGIVHEFVAPYSYINLMRNDSRYSLEVLSDSTATGKTGPGRTQDVALRELGVLVEHGIDHFITWIHSDANYRFRVMLQLAYERLDRIKYGDYFRPLLITIAFAFRPLSKKGLCDLLEVPFWLLEGFLAALSPVLQYPDNLDSGTVDGVRVVDPSFYRYITEVRDTQFRVPECEGHSFLAEKCCQLIHKHSIDDGPLQGNALTHTTSEVDLEHLWILHDDAWKYATRYALDHLDCVLDASWDLLQAACQCYVTVAFYRVHCTSIDVSDALQLEADYLCDALDGNMVTMRRGLWEARIDSMKCTFVVRRRSLHCEDNDLGATRRRIPIIRALRDVRRYTAQQLIPLPRSRANLQGLLTALSNHQSLIPVLGLARTAAKSRKGFVMVMPGMRAFVRFCNRSRLLPTYTSLYTLAQTIQRLHSSGIAHGMLNESHVFIDQNGSVRLSAVDTKEMSSCLYAGFQDNHDQSLQKADIASFALICVQALYGHKDRPGFLPGMPWITPNMWDLIAECRIKRPADRPTMDEVCTKMRRVVDKIFEEYRSGGISLLSIPDMQEKGIPTKQMYVPRFVPLMTLFEKRVWEVMLGEQ